MIWREVTSVIGSAFHSSRYSRVGLASRMLRRLSIGRAWGTFLIESCFKPVKWFGLQSDIPFSRRELRVDISPLKNRGIGRFCVPILWISRVWRFCATIGRPSEMLRASRWYTLAASFRARGIWSRIFSQTVFSGRWLGR